MSSTTISNPPSQTESKSAKKKRAKAEGAANASSNASNTPVPETGTAPAAPEGTTNGVEGSYESPYMKELYKLGALYINAVATSSLISDWQLTCVFPRNIRNITKKLVSSLGLLALPRHRN